MSVDSSILPPRFRESAFRRYESAIKAIVNSFPSVLTIDPIAYKLSPITVVSRLRDAITSLDQYHWKTTVDMKRFVHCRDQIVVVHGVDGKVFVGSRESLKNRKNGVAPVVYVDTSINDIDASLLSEQTLMVLCALASNRRFNCTMRFTNLSDTTIDVLKEQFDVEFERKSDDSVIMI